MTDETKNLKLFKYNTRTDRKEKFSIDDALNGNWDKVDEAVNANKESIAEVKEEVAGIISPPPIEFESGKFLSNDGNKLVWKEIKAGASGEELALKEDKANKGVPGGYAGLNAQGKVFGSQLDLSSKQDVLVPGEGIKIVGNTISSTVTGGASEEELALKEDKANKGVANGYAGLDADGKVPTAQLPNTSSGLELCDIGMALYVDETKGLRRYLNGQIVDINTNTQAFLNRLKEITTLHPSLLCTEEEWQTAKTMSVFGQVGKFVFNYSNGEIVSVRLPRVVNVQGLFDLQNLGMTVTESLPNFEIVSKTSSAFQDGTAPAKTKLTTISKPYGISTSATSYGDTSPAGMILNSSALGQGTSFIPDSSTYQDGAPVQQEAIQYPYFIQIATGSETENNIINEIELNNPYSLFDSKYSDHELNNLSWLKSSGQWNAKAVYPTAYDKLLKVYNGTETVEGLSVKLSTETYTDYDFILNTANETFRLPLKNHTADDGNSVLTLYYYVGETVQNANLIDAGRIGEQLATKTNMLQASSAGMPSSKYIDLTLGASGSTYTAPANGWFFVNGQSTSANQFINMGTGIGVTDLYTQYYSSASGQQINLYIPVKRGEVMKCYYSVTPDRLKFIYAEGSK